MGEMCAASEKHEERYQEDLIELCTYLCVQTVLESLVNRVEQDVHTLLCIESTHENEERNLFADLEALKTRVRKMLSTGWVQRSKTEKENNVWSVRDADGRA